MVILEFRPGEQLIAKAAGSDYASLDEAVLLHTFLVLPVRWKVGTVELLDARAIVPEQRGPTIELPLLHVDRVSRAAVEQAFDQGSANYSLPGSGEKILFSRVGREIEATSPFTGETSRASREDFHKAFLRFHDSMVTLVRTDLPRLSEHPWFGGVGR